MPPATACLVFVFWPFIDVFLRIYLNIYYASDSVSCIICQHSLIMQLKQQVLLPAASAKQRVVQSASCLVHELAIHKLAYCELSSYPSEYSTVSQKSIKKPKMKMHVDIQHAFSALLGAVGWSSGRASDL